MTEWACRYTFAGVSEACYTTRLLFRQLILRKIQWGSKGTQKRLNTERMMGVSGRLKLRGEPALSVRGDTRLPR